MKISRNEQAVWDVLLLVLFVVTLQARWWFPWVSIVIFVLALVLMFGERAIAFLKGRKKP